MKVMIDKMKHTYRRHKNNTMNYENILVFEERKALSENSCKEEEKKKLQVN